MADLLDLAAFMTALGNRIPNAASDGAKVVAMTVLQDLVQVTPVDTGEALSNWQVTLDAPAITTISPYFPSLKGKMIRGTWVHLVPPLATAQANIEPTLAAANVALQKKLPGHAIFITNNVEHIAALNNGTSSQAPSGFVDRAIILANQQAIKTKVFP